MITTDYSRHGSRPCFPALNRMLSLIEYKDWPLRFLILDCPTDSTLSFYIDHFKRLNASDVVRVCESTYNTAALNTLDIQVHDWPFKDGGLPPQSIVRDWLDLLDLRLREARQAIANGNDKEIPTIAVHCVAGLGRAPVLVAIALIEMGAAPLDAVEYIRSKRKGAFNSRQIVYLDTSYKRTMKWGSPLGASGSSTSFALGRGLGPKTDGSMSLGLAKMFKFGGGRGNESSSGSSTASTSLKSTELMAK